MFAQQDVTVPQTAQPKDQLWMKIQALDLEPIKFKLITEHGWKLELADMVEEQYKQYLYLAETADVENGLPPTKSIDEFWHAHILDTKKYAEDCESVFGRFIHHYPYFGLMGEADFARFSAAGEVAERLFKEVFGETPYGNKKTADCNSGCDGGGGCSSCVGCSTGPADDCTDLDPVSLQSSAGGCVAPGICKTGCKSVTDVKYSACLPPPHPDDPPQHCGSAPPDGSIKGTEKCNACGVGVCQVGRAKAQRPTRDDTLAFLERGHLIGWQ